MKKNEAHQNKTHSKIAIALSLVYILVVCVFMLAHRFWFSPDQFFFVALFGTLFLGRAQLFVMDWGPFLFLFFGYELLRGFVPFISPAAHIWPMIHIDKFLFGFIPTVKLQTLFYNPAHLQWYDYVAVILYICHFVTPMVVGFIFWLKDRRLFKEYALGLLILSYAAFFTFMIFPAMPPWMASSYGYIPPIKEVTGHVMSNFLPPTIEVPSIYAIMRSNPVAAMPSLHAAFPLLIFLFLVKKLKRWGLLFLPYVLGVWFAVMYLGEHYFADIIFGAIYAVAAFYVVEKKEFLLQKIKFLYPKKKGAEIVETEVAT